MRKFLVTICEINYGESVSYNKIIELKEEDCVNQSIPILLYNYLNYNKKPSKYTLLNFWEI